MGTKEFGNSFIRGEKSKKEKIPETHPPRCNEFRISLD
jgi:hypothetical protein